MSLLRALGGEIESGIHVAAHIGQDYFYEVINNHESKKKIPVDSSPVMLYHGYLVTHRCMAGLARHLKSEGFTPFVREYLYADDLEEVVKRRSKKLNEFCQRTGRKVDLVGHSLGGLIALRKAQENPELVNKVVMLGSPIHGTRIAYVPYLFHKSCRQMVPGSDFLDKIQHIGLPESVKFHSVATPYDEIVRPFQTSFFSEDTYQNVRNHVVTRVGHLGLIGPRCYNIVSNILKEK